MKMKWIVTAVAATVMTVPAFGQIGIYIGRTPPPMRYEEQPPMPGDGYIWVDGYWNWDGGRYGWIPGRWDRPPYAGAYWSHPHYDRYQQGWQMHGGHWDHEDHGNHYGEDRHGDHGEGHHGDGGHR